MRSTVISAFMFSASVIAAPLAAETYDEVQQRLSDEIATAEASLGAVRDFVEVFEAQVAEHDQNIAIFEGQLEPLRAQKSQADQVMQELRGLAAGVCEGGTAFPPGKHFSCAVDLRYDSSGNLNPADLARMAQVPQVMELHERYHELADPVRSRIEDIEAEMQATVQTRITDREELDLGRFELEELQRSIPEAGDTKKRLRAEFLAVNHCPPGPVGVPPTDLARTFIRAGNGQFGAPRSGGSHGGADIIIRQSASNQAAYAVHAVAAGKVAYARMNGSASAGFGNIVYIDHGNNCYSGYAHLANDPFTPANPGDNLGLTVGQQVKAGQIIGYFVRTDADIDSTGNAVRTHPEARHQTHFELVEAPSGRSGIGTLSGALLRDPYRRVSPEVFLNGVGLSTE